MGPELKRNLQDGKKEQSEIPSAVKLKFPGNVINSWRRSKTEVSQKTIKSSLHTSNSGDMV